MKNKIISFLSSKPVQWICCLILGGVFIYSSLPKIADYNGFAKIIANYKLLPETLVTLPAIILPWLELFSGIFLIMYTTRSYRRTAAFILSGLLLVFIAAISINLIRGLNFDCGCFSTITSATGSDPVELLIRDFLLLIPGVIVLFFNNEDPKPQPI